MNQIANENAGPVKPGDQTTEYRRARHAGVWGAVGLVLGGVITLVPSLVDLYLGQNASGSAAILAGATVSLASLAYKTLVDLGYIKSRTEVKISQEGTKSEK